MPGGPRRTCKGYDHRSPPVNLWADVSLGGRVVESVPHLNRYTRTRAAADGINGDCVSINHRRLRGAFAATFANENSEPPPLARRER